MAKLLFSGIVTGFCLGAGLAVAQGNEQKIGRPVRLVSLSFSGEPREKIAALVDEEAAKGVDLVALPEIWPGDTPETLDGPTVTAMAALAKKHHVYMVSPMYRKAGDRVYNTAVLLDREGKVACLYDKVYPFWAEWDTHPNLEPGKEAAVYPADFGKVGFAICFDANFPDVWKRLADQGAELVVWSSAYSAGSTLQSHALVHHFYIVTSTGARDCLVYDITGEKILDERSEGVHISRITLDLDRTIHHVDFNTEKKEKLLKEHADDILLDQWLPREAWFVLRAKRPGVSARALAREYGIEELRDYINRSRREIDKRRGTRLPQ
jgi:predicted amidohydrolase